MQEHLGHWLSNGAHCESQGCPAKSSSTSSKVLSTVWKWQQSLMFRLTYHRFMISFTVRTLLSKFVVSRRGRDWRDDVVATTAFDSSSMEGKDPMEWTVHDLEALRPDRR